MAEVISKYNSGAGALICSECGAILKEGTDAVVAKSTQQGDKVLAQNEMNDERIWESNGKIYMAYCVKCDRENYALVVSSGQCAWCGYQATKKDIKEK
jgi:NAD-dependent SIR2 family protein deacetylase